MDALRMEHKQVLKTMHITGVISKQTMKSVYGQILDMSDSAREEYLKKVIRNSIRKANISKEASNDDILRKKAGNVTKISKYIHILLTNMAEVMYSTDGIGLAANQIGVLKRLVVIDIGEGLIKLINPVIIHSSGEQVGQEGCLSIPDVWGMVKRPEKVVVNAINENGEKVEIKGENLLARVLCHEIDHLNGILFIDKAEPGTLKKIVKKERDLC